MDVHILSFWMEEYMSRAGKLQDLSINEQEWRYSCKGKASWKAAYSKGNDKVKQRKKGVLISACFLAKAHGPANSFSLADLLPLCCTLARIKEGWE